MVCQSPRMSLGGGDVVIGASDMGRSDGSGGRVSTTADVDELDAVVLLDGRLEVGVLVRVVALVAVAVVVVWGRCGSLSARTTSPVLACCVPWFVRWLAVTVWRPGSTSARNDRANRPWLSA